MADTVGAIVFFGRQSDFTSITRNNKTLQHFDYKCQRSRDVDGEPYGPTVSSLMTFTIRNVSGTDLENIYGNLKQATSQEFTFLFNVEFDASNNNVYVSHEAAMYVTGYVVDIEEYFVAEKEKDAEAKQMEMEVKLLLSNITYLGGSKEGDTSTEGSINGNTLVLLSNRQ